VRIQPNATWPKETQKVRVRKNIYRIAGDSPTTSRRREVGTVIICVTKTVGIPAPCAYSYSDLVFVVKFAPRRARQAGAARSELRRGTDMSLKMSTREVNGIIIIDLSGQITLGEAGAAIRDEVRDQLGNKFSKILLNLGDVTYIDSAGLGELTAAFTSVKNRGGALKLLNLTKRVRDLMQITKLYTVFDVYDDEKKAIASFSA
jgi:anti-sigma B factor antagonist